MNQQNFYTLITRRTKSKSYYRYVIKAPVSEDAANHQRTDPRRGLRRQEFSPLLNVISKEKLKKKEER